MIKLRDYQGSLKSDIKSAHLAHNTVLAVLPTGGGKTVIMADEISDEPSYSVAIAHRQELVGQISMALARTGVRHQIIAPPKVIRMIVRKQNATLGYSMYDAGAKCIVAGVDTLIRREIPWANQVKLWVMDEAHHVLRDNKWGKAVKMFPNARGLGFTATPERADGKGLGSHADGVVDCMVCGPPQRELINRGFLTDYRIFVPSSDIDLAEVKISKTTGDYNKNELKTAVTKSSIVGDVVSHYKRIANGLPGVTFATDVATATEIADSFNASGVPAAVVSAKNTDDEREASIRQFTEGKLLQLVNVDLFGEGFDLPAISAVSFARPTQSYGLYVQQFGRALRLLEGKDVAYIIDHVGNVMRHGLPDAPREWTLDSRDRRAKGNTDPDNAVKICINPVCMGVYTRFKKICPHCGHEDVPARRDGIEFVDGDLCELDPATLAALRGEVDKATASTEEYREELIRKNVPPIGQFAQVKRHAERQIATETLKSAILLWRGVEQALGLSDGESYRRFYLHFGVDVLTSQTLNLKKTTQLTEKIMEKIR